MSKLITEIKEGLTGPERGETMSGADILVACLEREGVDTIFAYPGGASMVMHQSLTRSKKSAPSSRVTSRAVSSRRKVTRGRLAKLAS